ncbi:MAG: AAA+-type ATPase (ISS) [Trebouxia sp. A1-2]|nr:MAG: AAA+-type ATPase (ISS) [Trebouxia sp. A1-2]
MTRTPSGASGQAVPRSRQRGGLPFKPASSQPQLGSQSKPQAERPANDQTAASQPVARQQSSVTKQPAALRKAARSRQIGSDTCQVCGGRGFQIVEEELHPCSVCHGENWAQPSEAPLSLSSPAPADQPQPSLALPDPNEPSGTASDSTPGRGRTKGGGRAQTEAGREKIRAAMKGRRWTDEHRRNISESMKGLWKNSTTRRSQVSASLMDKPKVCSYCGTVGHNRRGCPKLHPQKQHTEKERPATTGSRGRPRKTGNPVLDLELQQERQKAKEAEALNRKPQACSYCGELGHKRRGCPKLAREQQQEEEKKRREQLGPLWGLAGVEEQRMPGGRQGVLVFPVPFQIEDAVDQAAAAVVRAHAAGIRRQKLELLLPQAGVTSAQGSWPGGIRQQAQVAIPSLIEPLLRRLKQEDAFQGRMGAEWLDETDCVGSWQNERLAAVLFPTADTLSKVRQLARVKGPHRLMLLINPQWQTDGQVVSDFGFGRGRSDAEKFLAALQDVYCLERVRVLGDDIRLLKCYPGDWQVHYTWPNGRGSLLMGVEPTRPSYSRLVEMLKAVPNTKASRSWVDRVLDINNLKGVSRVSNSSLTQASYAGGLPVDEKRKMAAPEARNVAPMTSASASEAAPALDAAAAPAASKMAKGPSLRQRLQDAFAEQKQAADPASQSGVDRSSDTGSSSSGRADSNSGSGGISDDLADGHRSAVHAQLGAVSSQAAGALKSDGVDDVPAFDQQHPLAAYAVNQAAKAQTAVRKLDGEQIDARVMSIDGDDDGMLDRFGSVDIITGKPVRDLKLDPVLQLVKWRESLFGSRDSVSESLDKEDIND